MTIRHLKIFISVVELGKMSAAAEILHVSQPTISQAISQIEKYYNVLLFERLNRKLYITQEGKSFFDYAKHIITLFDEMEITMQNSSSNTILKIGATITVGICVFDTIVSEFEKQNPDIKINVFVDNTSVIEDMILKSTLDLALVEGEVKSTDIIIQPIIDDQLVLVCGNNHPMQGRNEIDITELEGLSFILREHGSGTRKLFETFLDKYGVNISEKWVSIDSEAIKNAVIKGQGLSVISKMLVEKEVEKKKLHIIKINNVQFQRKFSLIYHKNKYLSQPINRFWEYLNLFNSASSFLVK